MPRDCADQDSACPPVIAKPAAKGADAPRGHAASILLLALAIASLTATRIVFSPVQEAAKQSLKLSDLQISLAQGLAVAVPITLLAVPIGRLVDRAHRARLLAAVAAISTFGSFLTVGATGMATLFAARMLAGLGAMCALPIAISIAADLSAPDRRGRTLLGLSLGQMVGASAAFALGGALLVGLSRPWTLRLFAGLEPWRATHLVFGLAGAALTACLLRLKEPPRREVEKAHAPFAAALAAILARRAILLPLLLGQVNVVMADTAAGVWAAPVLSRNYHLPPAQFAGWMGLILLLSGSIGSILGGFAADLGAKSHLRGGLLLGAVLASAIAAPASAFPIAPGVSGFAACLTVLLVCGAVTGLVTTTAIAVLIPNELRGLCLSVFVMVGGLVGLGVAPTLVTLVAQALGGEGHLALALAATGVTTSLLAVAGFGLAMLAIRRERGLNS